MAGIHSIRCAPGSKKEKKFLNLLEKAEVKPDLVMCKKGLIFGTDYDEYTISDGLYRTIQNEFERIREI